MAVSNGPSEQTPLQKIVGPFAAENDYDLLDFREQLILDLRMAEWSQSDIGSIMGLSQGWVSILTRRIRYKMADSHLKRTLEIRQHHKEISPMMYERGFDDGTQA